MHDDSSRHHSQAQMERSPYRQVEGRSATCGSACGSMARHQDRSSEVNAGLWCSMIEHHKGSRFQMFCRLDFRHWHLAHEANSRGPANLDQHGLQATAISNRRGSALHRRTVSQLPVRFHRECIGITWNAISTGNARKQSNRWTACALGH